MTAIHQQEQSSTLGTHLWRPKERWEINKHKISLVDADYRNASNPLHQSQQKHTECIVYTKKYKTLPVMSVIYLFETIGTVSEESIPAAAEE